MLAIISSFTLQLAGWVWHFCGIRGYQRSCTIGMAGRELSYIADIFMGGWPASRLACSAYFSLQSKAVRGSDAWSSYRVCWIIQGLYAMELRSCHS